MCLSISSRYACFNLCSILVTLVSNQRPVMVRNGVRVPYMYDMDTAKI